MRQDINFYRGGTGPSAPPFGARWLGRAALAVLALLACVSIVRLVVNQRASTELTLAMEQAGALQSKVDDLRQRYPEPRTDPVLLGEAERLQGKLVQLEQLLRRVEGGELASRGGFSAYFQALARRTVADVWLTGIHFSAGGSQLELEGKALRAEEIPHMLQVLGQEPAFQSRSFSALHIKRPDQEPGQVNFILRTQVPKGAGKS